MKILAIVGSKRRGNTYAMVEAGCHALKDSEVELLHLKDLNILSCDGCLQCDDTGKCHIEDDMSNIINRIANADGFIFGTPARWSLLSGELKTFFDRLNPLAMPEKLSNKKAIIFSVGQTEGEEAESIKLSAESVKYFCENAGIEVVDVVLAEGCANNEDLISKLPNILDVCKKSAMKLQNSLSG